MPVTTAPPVLPANLQTTLAAVDQRMLIYPYNTCGTIEKKLRAAKLCGWSGVDAAFRLGLVHTRPLVYNVASAPNVSVPAMQEATEQLVPRPKQFQCAHCGRTYVSMPSLRLHHERCNLKRDCTGESDACVVRIFTEAVAEDMQCLRCMRCYRQYCDKSSYNRHLATNAGCRKAPSFQRIAGAAVAAVAAGAVGDSSTHCAKPLASSWPPLLAPPAPSRLKRSISTRSSFRLPRS